MQPQRHIPSQRLSHELAFRPPAALGRLFDTAAALLGFAREITFEGQAAMWLERLAREASSTDAYPFPYVDGELDFRPLLDAVVRDRLRARPESEVARAFQRGIAQGLRDAVSGLCSARAMDTVVLSGGVFQNELLLTDVAGLLKTEGLRIWMNHVVPSNDGGISLGQAAIAAVGIVGYRSRFEAADIAWTSHVT